MFRLIFRFSIVILVVTRLDLQQVLALSNSLIRSSIRLTEPITGCHVVLVGCFHGSPTSAADVREALDASLHAIEGTQAKGEEATKRSDDHAVVLELCASRCADLMKTESLRSSTKTPWIIRYTKHIQATARKQGVASAVATALLAGASGLQSSRLEPGLEFKTALDIAKERQMDVILADQSADLTVQKLGTLPQTVMTVWQRNEWWSLATSLTRATLGMKTYHLNLPLFLVRSKEAVGDAVSFILQPLGILLTLQLALATLDTAELESAADIGNFAEDWSRVLNTFLILGLYTVVVLPATKIVVSERDDVLTKGIQTACRGRKHVVAVLGLLHVNGVADRLIAAGFRPTHDAETALSKTDN